MNKPEIELEKDVPLEPGRNRTLAWFLQNRARITSTKQDAHRLIKAGRIYLNGEKITEPTERVCIGDTIEQVLPGSKKCKLFHIIEKHKHNVCGDCIYCMALPNGVTEHACVRHDIGKTLPYYGCVFLDSHACSDFEERI